MPQSFAEIAQYAALLRDVGIVLGFPVLVVIAQRMHAKHIAMLQAQVEVAKATQYDRALALIESQKKLFLAEREMLEGNIAELQKSGEKHRDEIVRLQVKVRDLNVGVDQLTKITYNIEESLADTPEGVSIYQGLLIGKCDGMLFKTRLNDDEITHISRNPELLASADRLLDDIREGAGRPNRAMQPTTLWRCVPMLTLTSMLGMKPCAPARVVADLESR